MRQIKIILFLLLIITQLSFSSSSNLKGLLFEAIKNNNFIWIKRLVKRGAPTKHALSYAVKYTNLEVVKYLIKNGADVNMSSKLVFRYDDIVYKNGVTPLKYAKIIGNKKAYKLLKKYGAKE